MERVKVERKIIRMGNSYGSTYPQKILDHLHVKQGDQVMFELQSNGTVTIRKQNRVELPDGISPDFIKTVTGVMNQYDKAIKELADK